jgi:hypothetical protein
MTLFTDWVPTQESQYNYGWLFIVIVLINVSTNFALILYLTFKNLMLVGEKCYNIYTNFQLKNKNENETSNS